MISKNLKLKLFSCIALLFMGIGLSEAQEINNSNTVSYKYPFVISADSSLNDLKSIRTFSSDDIMKTMKQRALNGDVIAEWLLADAYTRNNEWNIDATQWVFIGTLNLLMDASVCTNPNDAKYAMYHINALFGNSVLNVRMHPLFIKDGLIKARDYILEKHWIKEPAYYPTEICTNPESKLKNPPVVSLFKDSSDWEALRSKVFIDFMQKGNVDAIPDKNNDKNYQGPAWIK